MSFVCPFYLRIFLQNSVCASPLIPTCNMPLSFNFPDLVTVWYLVRSKNHIASFSPCKLLQFPDNFSSLGPDIFLTTLSSHKLNLCYSVKYETPSFTPIKTAGNILVLYILMSIFLKENWNTKVLGLMVVEISWVDLLWGSSYCTCTPSELSNWKLRKWTY